ncbi:3-phosphoshikimate 1-carboxyvinyltransferase, partial [Alistipes putredinis]
VEGLVSSQFITGLLLALPIAEEETTIHVPHVISTPYIDITIDTAERFGIEILHKDYKEFYVAGGQRYRPAEFEIESDWSAAAFLLVAGAVAGEVTIRNLSVLSRQADTAVMTALIRAGASVIDEGDTITVAHRPLQAFSFDATQCPGLFPALAALAASAEGTSVIKGTSRLENKEGNRAESIREEYAKLGIEVDLDEEDTMKIRGGRIRGGHVHSHDDHRIAMSLAVAALNADTPVVIENPACVAKSFPDFFERLESLRTVE